MVIRAMQRAVSDGLIDRQLQPRQTSVALKHDVVKHADKSSIRQDNTAI